jgi:desulfoferrodoxin-like iron-binding protein
VANQLGKIYLCSQCGSQFIVTKAGVGEIKCCGKPMEQKK